LYVQDSASQVIAVEPTPTTLNVMKHLIKDHNKIKIVPAALSNHNGTIDFFIHDNPTINSTDVDQDGARVTVQAKTIATILKENNLEHVDFVKCDIEGSEMSALTDETLAEVKDQIDSWFIEIHQTNRKESVWPGNMESNRQEIMRRLERAGYSTVAIIHDQIFAWK
jgi:hypothetical protein